MHACFCTQDAIEDYSSAFCNLEEVTGLAEFPDVKPHGGNEEGKPLHSDSDDVTKLAWS
jgi:hypothetical protein